MSDMDEGEGSGKVLCASTQKLIIYKEEGREPDNVCSGSSCYLVQEGADNHAQSQITYYLGIQCNSGYLIER